MSWLIWLYTVIFFFGIYFMLMFLMLYFRNKKDLNYYPKPTKFPFVSLITPAYNEEKSVAETINALLKLDYPKDKLEIIVVNDGSTDKTKEIVMEFVKKYDRVKLLNKKNSGKADSLNQAIERAKGELITVVDADSYPTPQTLKRMIGFFEEDEKVAAVTSKVWVKNNTNKFIERFQDVDYAVIAWSRKILDFIGCVYVTNGPFSVYRKDKVLEVGGFDVTNITEDIELTWNLLSHGYKTKMSYAAKVYTLVPDNLEVWRKQRVRWNLGGLQTLNKYRNYFLRGENLFGYFVMSYVSVSFILSFLGLFLLSRYFYLRFAPYVFSLPYFFEGYNPFLFFDFYIPFTLLLMFGIVFLILSVSYHKLTLKGTEVKNKSIRTILVYTFIYRPLYLIPLVISIYKLIKGDIRWYTK
ncbi:glycosyltransferase family 2 protein [Candidatus Woesearchaeota archaeon]|jgi:poly-beta-1,6-N-acetyl-D-glucosamine synthase|nr:glycosyltransferase family 2 protein [Candidatus Woesearchaeota archaeon]